VVTGDSNSWVGVAVSSNKVNSLSAEFALDVRRDAGCSTELLVWV